MAAQWSQCGAGWPSNGKFLRVMCVFRIVYGVVLETLALQVRLHAACYAVLLREPLTLEIYGTF